MKFYIQKIEERPFTSRFYILNGMAYKTVQANRKEGNSPSWRAKTDIFIR